MIDHQPDLTVAKLLHKFSPVQPFETARSRNALADLRNAFENGRSFAVLNRGWRRGSNLLVQRFVAGIDAGVSVLRLPETCSSELEGMRVLIRGIGFEPRELSATDLQKIFIKYLGFQNRRKRRTVLILEDAADQGRWMRDYVTQLVEMDANAKFGLMVILMRQTKLNKMADELPLDSLSYHTAKHIALTPLTQVETRKFIRWRIDAVQEADISSVFDFDTVTLIHELCEGVPDAIEHLCCASLMLAESQDAAPVTTDIVMQASKDLPEPSVTRQPGAQSRLVASQVTNIPTLALPGGPSIVLKYQGKVVRQVPLNQKRVSIGRAAENDLCIDSLYVSRDHATIFKNGPDTAIVDLDSKNGTFVNSRRIQAHTITDQDEISLGHHTIQLLDPNAPRIRALNNINRSRPSVTVKIRRELPATGKEEIIRARRE